MVSLRSIQLDDGPRLQAFMQSLSDESRYFRFMDAIRELPPRLLRYFIEIDVETDLALVAVIQPENEGEVIVGVARYYGDDDGQSCEFAIAVADAWHHHGIGQQLMLALLEGAAHQNYRRIHGEVMAENQAMLHLMHHLGFTVRTCREDAMLKCVERDVPPLAMVGRPGLSTGTGGRPNPCTRA